MHRVLLMHRDAEYYQRDAGGVLNGRDLAQHDHADDDGEDRQQRQHEREGGAGQPGHGQLIGDVGDDRGADTLFTPHGRTTTSIMHSAPVPPRPLPVPAG